MWAAKGIFTWTLKACICACERNSVAILTYLSGDHKIYARFWLHLLPLWVFLRECGFVVCTEQGSKKTQAIKCMQNCSKRRLTSFMYQTLHTVE